MIACPICNGFIIPFCIQAFKSDKHNRKFTLRSYICDLQRLRKSVNRDELINKLVQELFDIDPDDAEKFIEQSYISDNFVLIVLIVLGKNELNK